MHRHTENDTLGERDAEKEREKERYSDVQRLRCIETERHTLRKSDTLSKKDMHSERGSVWDVNWKKWFGNVPIVLTFKLNKRVRGNVKRIYIYTFDQSSAHWNEFGQSAGKASVVDCRLQYQQISHILSVSNACSFWRQVDALRLQLWSTKQKSNNYNKKIMTVDGGPIISKREKIYCSHCRRQLCRNPLEYIVSR